MPSYIGEEYHRYFIIILLLGLLDCLYLIIGAFPFIITTHVMLTSFLCLILSIIDLIFHILLVQSPKILKPEKYVWKIWSLYFYARKIALEKKGEKLIGSFKKYSLIHQYEQSIKIYELRTQQIVSTIFHSRFYTG